ncbi:MAG: NAD-dependent epimerase/dehydratase family protein [Desulfocapsaceae bacterium]|jgi:nucleoside-diphosphate-sugar epimerase|nr:NAD-dependent epimerase/dehydratase family protein [Desulfocapsaceae bacterium]
MHNTAECNSSPIRIGVLFGGSGLIGGTMVNYFKSKKPGIVDMRAPSSKKVSLRNCQDIRDYLLSLKPDFIINTAITNIDAGSQLTFEVNYIGAVNIARAAAALNIPYIHFSSAATLPAGIDLDEDDQVEMSPHLSNYAKSKLMAEKTLRYMAENEGLDFSCIRLSIAYGNHDHKIQGFQRLLFSVIDQSMPFLFTRKGIIHSYSNSRKLPYLVHHMLDNREEFGGNTYHFVDREPVELSRLILTIKSQLNLRSPKKIYIPYTVARTGKKSVKIILRMLTKIGLKATLPPELMFLRSFYQTQTLSGKRLEESSFVDPMPDETVFTRLPEMINYYLTRWSHQNLISTYDEKLLEFDRSIESDFKHDPEALLESIHRDATTPFTGFTVSEGDKKKWVSHP